LNHIYAVKTAYSIKKVWPMLNTKSMINAQYTKY